MEAEWSGSSTLEKYAARGQMVSFWRQVIRGLRLCKRTTVAKNNERTTKTLYQKQRNLNAHYMLQQQKVSFFSCALLSTHQVSSRVESRLRIGANGSHFEAYPFSWFCCSILAHQKQFPKEIPSHGVCECVCVCFARNGSETIVSKEKNKKHALLSSLSP